jgi:hypothetical protein
VLLYLATKRTTIFRTANKCCEKLACQLHMFHQQKVVEQIVDLDR